MKFSDLLGEPEPESRPEPEPASEPEATAAEPISVFSPVPVAPPPEAPPDPPGPVDDATTELPVAAPPPPPPPPPPPVSPSAMPESRSGLAELNVRRPSADSNPTAESSVLDQLVGLDEIVDDLLPSRRTRR